MWKPKETDPNTIEFTLNRKYPLKVDPAQPTRSWQRINTKYYPVKIDDYSLTSWPDDQPDDVVRLVCISDIHNRFYNMPRIPPGDILIISGDLTMAGSPNELKKFHDWLIQIDGFQHIVFTAGNHDIALDQHYYQTSFRVRERLTVDERIQRSESVNQLFRNLKTKNIHYLENESIELLKIKFWGSPVTPEFCDWSFARNRGQDIDQIWSQIPNDTDVVITHGPPLGIGDVNTMQRINCGCANLLWHISERVKPKLHVFGHIHESRGLYTDGTTNFANCAICTRQYKAENLPIVVDYKLD